jgi:hypothetical protein
MVVSCLMLLALPAAALAQSAPAAMRGKSVVVTWSENRTQRFVGEQQVRHLQVGYTMSVYVSSAGRPFSRLTATMPRGGSGSAEHVGAGGRSSSGGARQVQFQGRSLVMTAGLTGGARRISVDFGDAFTSCSARVLIAKQVGSQSMRGKGLVSGRELEILSASAGSASCSVREGNVFGG